jgi:hypothetical protein
VPFGDLRATVAAIGRALDDQLPLENVGADFQARYGRDARRTALLNLVQHLTGHVFDEVASVPWLEPARSAASVSWSRKS